MRCTYIDAKNRRVTIDLEQNVDVVEGFKRVDNSTKLAFIREFIPAFLARQKMVLFDEKHKQLLAFYEKIELSSLKNRELLNAKTQLLFFTSGSSGFPLGAFKTQENLEQEVRVLKKLVCHRTIKKVVVSVPFVHIYGVLAGLLLPLALGDVELVLKEDFLPYEIIEELQEGETLVITTPVFIKALGKLSQSVDMKSSTFISSTAPLHKDDVLAFERLYGARLLQLFGSTETGGIAYKEGSSEEWQALESVEVGRVEERLSIVSPFVSEHILKEASVQELQKPFVSEDIIEIYEGGFKLLGRSNKLIKIAGKRISALAIEATLEEMEEVQRAVVSLVYKKELLRSEQILISLEAKRELTKSEIKEKISTVYGLLTIPFKVDYVEKIELSAMGKKVLF